MKHIEAVATALVHHKVPYNYILLAGYAWALLPGVIGRLGVRGRLAFVCEFEE